jgi:uncharacterized protein YbjT (DUF2867 family)
MKLRGTGAEPVLVTGGTGTLGTHVVQDLRDRGCQVRVLSRKQRASSPGVTYVAGDLANGTGVQEAVAGAGVIIHCASAKKGDVQATQTLVKAAAAQSRLPHLVYISIVGADGIGFSYFKAKLAAEKIVAGSGLPWTLQRATQFYDFVLSGATSMARSPSSRCRRTSPASRSTPPMSPTGSSSSRSAHHPGKCPTSAALKCPPGPT